MKSITHAIMKPCFFWSAWVDSSAGGAIERGVMNWYAELNIIPVSKENATHMVVGRERGEQYNGIIAYADNQFTAHRIRRAVINAGVANVKVLPYNDRTVDAVERNIETNFFKSR